MVIKNESFVWLVLYFICIIRSYDLNVGFIIDINGSNKGWARPMQAAGNIAINQINNDINLLHDCKIRATIIDSKSKTYESVYGALQLIGQNNDINNDSSINTITVPFIIGATFSRLSFYLNPVISAFNVLQISPSATSESLTAFKHFHRVVPNDGLQAEALVQLCTHFNWTNIGILYVNDAYGIYLFSSILTRAAEIPGFKITGVSFETTNEKSIENGVNGIKTAGVLVTIILAFHADMEAVIYHFKNVGMWEYPYYFLGCDAWLVCSIYYLCLCANNIINVHLGRVFGFD